MIAPPRLLLWLAVVALPWVIFTTKGYGTLLFGWGLVSLPPVSVTFVWDYVFVYTRGLPWFLLTWPLATFAFGAGILFAGSNRWFGCPRIIPTMCFALATVLMAHFGLAFTIRRQAITFPLGVVFLALLTLDWYRQKK